MRYFSLISCFLPQSLAVKRNSKHAVSGKTLDHSIFGADPDSDVRQEAISGKTLDCSAIGAGLAVVRE